MSSWLGIILMTLIVLVGLVSSVVLSKDAVQKKASAFAFISLALLFILFCIVVIELSQVWIIPVFTLACIFVPIAIYAITSASLLKKAPASARHASPSRRPDVAFSSSVAEEPTVDPDMQSASPLTQDVWVTESFGMATVEGKPKKGKPQAAAEKRPSFLDLVDEAPPLVEEEAAVIPTPVAVASDAESAEKPQTTAAEPDTSEQSGPAVPGPLETRVPEVLLENAFEQEKHAFVSQSDGAVIDDKSTEDALAPTSEPAPEVPEENPFETCFNKAESFKKKGVPAIAARLYVESANLADQHDLTRKALFEAVSCYVKADMLGEARKAAARLEDSVDELSPLELMKLDAVLRAG